MVVTCEISFDNNPQGVYFVGQSVIGRITLTADKVKQVKAVSLKMNGFAYTRWQKNDSKNSTDNIFEGRVDYLNTLTYLLAPDVNGKVVLIKPGIHTFSFACRIPLNCPSSFEGHHGHIRYIIQVNLIRPWKYDQTFTIAFTVNTIKDLNYGGPLLRMPANKEVSKAFCCGLIKSYYLQMHVQLPQTGYVPGQFIPVSILIKNSITVNIDEICVRLIMMMNLYSTSPQHRSKRETMIISMLKDDSKRRHCKEQFNYLLPIPATPPTCSNLCTLIQISYVVEVEAKISRICYANQCVQIPVIIGNVPLEMHGAVVTKQPVINQLPVESVDALCKDVSIKTINDNTNEFYNVNRITEPWSTYESIPTPIFMEASHMSPGKLCEDLVHDYGEKIFSPKYPVFNITSPDPIPIKNGEDDVDGQVASPADNDSIKTTWL